MENLKENLRELFQGKPTQSGRDKNPIYKGSSPGFEPLTTEVKAGKKSLFHSACPFTDREHHTLQLNTFLVTDKQQMGKPHTIR